MTEIAVVVPVRNDPERLARCLDALAAQTLPRGSYEVVVVDDGSTEPVPQPHGVRVLRQDNAGSYAARNAGVAATSAPVLAFTDADCVPDSSHRGSGLRALRNADVVAGAVEVTTRGSRPGAVELYDAVTGFPQERFVREWGFGATANVIARRSVFVAVGEFDARLRSGGDAEWGERASASGARTVYAPDVVVRHPARASWSELREKSARTARGVEDLGRLRGDVTPLPEAVRRHLLAPVGRVREARAAGVAPRDLPRFSAVAVVAAVVGATEVLRGRAGRSAVLGLAFPLDRAAQGRPQEREVLPGPS
jgi:hypothetical protein